MAEEATPVTPKPVTPKQIADYLRANPDVAKKVKEYAVAHPDDTKAAIKEIAAAQGWDLSKVDQAALKAEFAKLK